MTETTSPPSSAATEPPENLARGLRSHYCGQLSQDSIGQQVQLCGWVDRRREHGEHLAFVDLRDHTGVVQCVVDERLDVRTEYVVRISGVVRPRPEGTVNENLATGTLEIGDCQVEVLNRAEPPPFSLHDTASDETSRLAEETTRLRYRYVDMRRDSMQQNLRLRARVNGSFRSSMERLGFLELETPMLIASTPEGARDFVVPSRLHQGSFYALPQSPQIFKQLAMVGGIDRYYQIARCLRDEDLRADRQFEFMQLDLEASFVGKGEIVDFVSEVVADAVEVVRGERPGEIGKISWQQAQDRFGTDKPDMRFGLELCDVTSIFAGTEAKVFQAESIKGFCLSGGAALSRNRIDNLTELVQSWGAKGLAWFRVADGLSLDGALTRFMSQTEMTDLTEKLNAAEGDLLLLVADKQRVVNQVLGRLRLELAADSAQNSGAAQNSDAARNSSAAQTPSGPLQFVWVVDFPLFEGFSDDGTPIPAHHPFTMPHPDDLERLQSAVADGSESELLSVRSLAYDLVLNGWELGSGSVRISEPELQHTMFSLLGMSDEQVSQRFGFMIDAFRYGTPPHAGFALGIDRFVSILAGADTIREVIAFPKTQSGADPLTGAPTSIDRRHLRELGIRLPEPDNAGTDNASQKQ